jgi:gamma-glutamylcyclotransferase (GGCT)/AIG2-like uncharacterized protein YtfP
MAGHLFVYGTLRDGFAGPMARRLKEACGEPVSARVPGRIFDLGDYPGMVAAESPEDRVRGDVFTLPDDPAELLAELDEYEDVAGGLYARVELPAELADGGSLSVYAYLYKTRPVSVSWIPEGDYLVYLERKRC